MVPLIWIALGAEGAGSSARSSRVTPWRSRTSTRGPSIAQEKGIVGAPVGDLVEGAKATARRSTGINPEARDPIDPRMPNLPPA